MERFAFVDREEAWDVFPEEPGRFNLTRDAPDFFPEPAPVVDALSFAGDGSSRARESGSDEIHLSAQAFASEGFQIVEDKTQIHGTFDHSTSEDGTRVGLPLNSSHK